MSNRLEPTIYRLTEAGFLVNTAQPIPGYDPLYDVSYMGKRLGYFGLMDGKLSYSIFSLSGEAIEVIADAPYLSTILDGEAALINYLTPNEERLVRGIAKGPMTVSIKELTQLVEALNRLGHNLNQHTPIAFDELTKLCRQILNL
jgi:hypothetical protein